MTRPGIVGDGSKSVSARPVTTVAAFVFMRRTSVLSRFVRPRSADQQPAAAAGAVCSPRPILVFSKALIARRGRSRT